MSIQILDTEQLPVLEVLKEDCKNQMAYLQFSTNERLIKAVIFFAGSFKLIWEGYVDPKKYSYEDILNINKQERWAYRTEPILV